MPSLVSRFVLALLTASLLPTCLLAQDNAPPNPEYAFPLFNMSPPTRWNATVISGKDTGGIRVAYTNKHIAYPSKHTLQALIQRDSAVDITYRRLLRETENQCWGLCVGTRLGITFELYLGHGFGAKADLCVPTPKVELTLYATQDAACFVTLTPKGVSGLRFFGDPLAAPTSLGVDLAMWWAFRQPPPKLQNNNQP